MRDLEQKFIIESETSFGLSCIIKNEKASR